MYCQLKIICISDKSIKIGLSFNLCLTKILKPYNGILNSDELNKQILIGSLFEYRKKNRNIEL